MYHYQTTWEALSTCHAIHRKPGMHARQMMNADLFATHTHNRMLHNARDMRQWYQAAMAQLHLSLTQQISTAGDFPPWWLSPTISSLNDEMI